MATLKDHVLKQILATRLEREVYWVDPLTGEAHRRVERVPLAQDEPAPGPVAAPVAEAPVKEPTTDFSEFIDPDIWDLRMAGYNPEIVGTIDKAVLINISSGSITNMMLMTIARRLKRMEHVE